MLCFHQLVSKLTKIIDWNTFVKSFKILCVTKEKHRYVLGFAKELAHSFRFLFKNSGFCHISTRKRFCFKKMKKYCQSKNALKKGFENTKIRKYNTILKWSCSLVNHFLKQTVTGFHFFIHFHVCEGTVGFK